MAIVDIINKKRLGNILTRKELEEAFLGYYRGDIPDYQMSSLLMAICLKGMTDEEILNLTDIFIHSGDILDLSGIHGITVDKHSTGGVGDKTTLVVASIVASLGVKVPKMSGRGLGYTGGTIDKLESIPGFNVNLSKEQFIKEIENVGMAITSQTEDIAVADKKIYALRDVTGTTESVPLIASSIMSKKIASGSKNLVLDIKVGEGALIKNITDARRLANLMIKIGHENDMRVICLLTNMNIPLGNNIGNSLEVLEALNILYYGYDNNLMRLCIELASYMVKLGLNISYEEARNMVVKAIKDKKAYNKLLEFIKYQGGDINSLPKSKYIYEIKSVSSGYLYDIHSLEVAKLSSGLGAGRKNKDDKIDYSAGVIINKNINDIVEVGDTIMTLYTNKEVSSIDINKLFIISNNKNDDNKLIYEVIE